MREFRVFVSGKFQFAIKSEDSESEVAARARAAMNLGDNYVCHCGPGLVHFFVP